MSEDFSRYTVAELDALIDEAQRVREQTRERRRHEHDGRDDRDRRPAQREDAEHHESQDQVS